jgi:hypothetical protein
MKFRSNMYKTRKFDVIKSIISINVIKIRKAMDLSTSLRSRAGEIRRFSHVVELHMQKK